MEFNVVNNPHDALFKRTMTNSNNAKEFIVNYLPGELVSRLDLEKLTICKDSFIGKDLEESYSDILYRTEIDGRDSFIYMLFEHKSYPDRMAAVQLLRYMLDIWELYRKQTGTEKLPVIIPVLFYHGQKKWNAGSRLMNIIEDVPSVCESYIPDYEFLLYNLSEFDREDIRGSRELQAYLTLTSYLAEENVIEAANKALSSLLNGEGWDERKNYIETVIRYILSISEGISLRDLESEVVEAHGERGEVIMTIAEKLREEGIKEGEIKLITRLITARFGEKPGGYIEKLSDLDEEALELLAEKVMEVDSLAELEEYLQELNK